MLKIDVYTTAKHKIIFSLPNSVAYLPYIPKKAVASGANLDSVEIASASKFLHVVY